MADPIRALHVEDDPEFADVTAAFLERENDWIDVRTETDPATALERIEGDDVDCVVSDYDMPGMDGVELLKRVRETDADLPFVLFTGKGSEEVASEALSEGATDYLQKQTGTDQYALLANRIENAVVQHRSVVELERQSEILETAQEVANIGVCEYDVETGQSWLSQGMFEVFDLPRDARESPDSVGFEQTLSFYHPEDRSTVEAALERALEDAESAGVEVRLATDAERWVHVRTKPHVDDGAVRRIHTTIQEITGRKARECERRRNERRFEAVFQDPQQLVGLLEPDGTVADSNETSMEYVEADFEDVVGEPFWETPWWDTENPAKVKRWIDRAADGEYVSYDADLDHPDGTPYTVSGAIRPVRDENGAVASLIVSAQDVTRRRINTEERAFFEALVEETTDLITVIDDEGTIQYQSPAVESVLGYEQDEMCGDAVVEYLHPDERADITAQFESFVAEAGQRELSVEHRVRHADGTWRWIESEVCDLADATLADLVITSRDVTERTEREQELESFEQIIEGLGESIFVVDEHCEMTHVNTVGARISGYDADEIMAAGVDLLYDDEDIERMRRAIGDLTDSDDEVAVVEVDMERRDGSTVPAEATLTAQTDEDGEFAGAVGVVKDVSGRKETERERREYESILRAIPDEVTILDTDGAITRILPPAGAETTASGYDPAELEGEHISTVMTDDDLQRGVELIEELVTTERERGAFEMEVVTRDGERLWREDNIALLEDDEGEIRGTVGVLRDIEERKAYERELERQNERLEEFAEITSHDMRNPLNLAQGYLELVEEECDSDHIETVRDALDRMAKLVDDTLTMARQGATVSDRSEVDLASLVPNCWEAVGAESATLEVVDSARFRGDESRIRQVIENLLRNAVEHGGDGVSVQVGSIDGDGFYVEDDGPGITPEERESIFEAGFTTDSDGTGFGLAIVGEIVEAHGWELAVTESDEGGARFEITDVDVTA